MAEDQQTGREPDGSLLEEMRTQLRRDPEQPTKTLKLPQPVEAETPQEREPSGLRRFFRR